MKRLHFVLSTFRDIIVYDHGLDGIHMYPLSTAASLFNIEEPAAPMTAITH